LVSPDALVKFFCFYTLSLFSFFFPFSLSVWQQYFFFAQAMQMESQQRRGGDPKSHWM